MRSRMSVVICSLMVRVSDVFIEWPPSLNPPAEWIVIVEEQGRLAVHVGLACEGRNGLVAFAAIARMEGAAGDALLNPLFALGEFSIGGKARELGAGACPARRAVVGFARAQHEIARMRTRRGGRPEELDMVDVVMAERIDRLAKPPAVIGEGVDVVPREPLAVILHQQEP